MPSSGTGTPAGPWNSPPNPAPNSASRTWSERGTHRCGTQAWPSTSYAPTRTCPPTAWSSPSLYLIDDAGPANLTSFAERGGTLAVGFHSGAVDENCHVRLGGYPGAFRNALGVRTDELFPLLPCETRQLTGQVPPNATATLWSEHLRLTSAEPIASYADGPLAGVPAVTRNVHGHGTAWYLATRPDPDKLAALLGRIRDGADVRPGPRRPAGRHRGRSPQPDRRGPTCS